MISLFARTVRGLSLLLMAMLGLVGLLVSARAAGVDSSLIGLWLTQDRDGVIEITQCDAGLCGHIAGLFLDHPGDPTPVDHRGVSQCGLPLITDARQIRLNLWKGHITDPRNGNVYGVELHLDQHGNLALHGFIGIPLFGSTQTWTRYAGRVPDDCRLAAADAGGVPSRGLSKRPLQEQ